MKILGLGFALVLVAGLGTACGGGDDDDDDANTPLTTEEKMEQRAALLAASDDYSFDSPPATVTTNCDVTLEPTGTGDADALIEAIELASSWTIICLAPGTWAMDKSIVISAARSLTIKGIGATPADTVLDFAGHTGDKGFDVTTPGFWIENLHVKNTIGNGVEVKADSSADDPTVYRKVKVSWDVTSDVAQDCGDDDPRREHGAYSVYPTRSSYVVVEFCETEGAADAGLYIGQVEHGIVRHNQVHDNVAGLEVENSFDVDVYDNEVFRNSTGILALQEPGLTRLTNDTVLIRDNEVYRNNGCNFARPNTTVANVPQGTGMLSLGSRNVEFRNNVIRENTTAGIILASNVLLSLIAGDEPDFPEDYDPFPHEIYMVGNTFSDNATEAPTGDVGTIAGFAGGFEDVVWGGFRAPGVSAEDTHICLGDNPPGFVDLTAGACPMPASEEDFISCMLANVSRETTAHTCTGSVTVTGF